MFIFTSLTLRRATQHVVQTLSPVYTDPLEAAVEMVYLGEKFHVRWHLPETWLTVRVTEVSLKKYSAGIRHLTGQTEAA